jgi:hypothetical protein
LWVIRRHVSRLSKGKRGGEYSSKSVPVRRRKTSR